MTKRLHVRVTRDHIAQGIQQSCHYCPIALAVRDATGSGTVSVGRHEIHWDNGWKHGAVPQSARRFISAFDRPDGKNTAQPFGFYLTVDA